jgi:hypothetical protein
MVTLARRVAGSDPAPTTEELTKWDKRGQSAVTDESGLARVRVSSNSIVGGPFLFVRARWHHRHPPDFVTGKRFFVRIATADGAANGEITAEPGSRADIGEFAIDVTAVGRPVDPETVGCTISGCGPDQ